ncbi:MAG: hypothetical protein CMM32_09360, partial [Rhodospirillaceae bacterium]|nr:hypothetical protein [Rhodospirillaceae bacterium]
ATHSHPYDADVIIMQGNIKIVTDCREYNLRPGDEFQLDSGIMHTEETGGKGVVILAAVAKEATPTKNIS